MEAGLFCRKERTMAMKGITPLSGEVTGERHTIIGLEVVTEENLRDRICGRL